MTAQTKDEYIQAWLSHVRQLAMVAFDADRSNERATPGYDLLKQIEKLSTDLINRAADANFPNA